MSEYLSINQYCTVKKIEKDSPARKQDGKKLAILCKSKGIMPIKILDEPENKFCVNSYPVEILDEYFLSPNNYKIEINKEIAELLGDNLEKKVNKILTSYLKIRDISK